MIIHSVRLCLLRVATAAGMSAVSASLTGCGGVPVTTGEISERNPPITAPGPNRWNEASLHTFNYTDGAYNIYAGLVFDAAGNLYGTTQSGGEAGCNIVESCGIVFELMRTASGNWQEKVLHSFFASDPLGFFPRAGLTLDAKGDLFGSTSAGGPYCSGSVNCGAIFELFPNNGQRTEKVLHGFRGEIDGTSPEGALIFDAAGNLYGTTAEGGERDDGTIFELTPQRNGSWEKSTLHSFTNDEGSGPEGKLAFDSAGNLYGTTEFSGAYRSACGGYGCGTAFELKPGTSGTWTLKVLHSFGKGIDGAGPASGLTFDASGNLFGVTAQGGAHSAVVPHACLLYGCGTVFKLARSKKNKWTERVIHDFGYGTDGNLTRGDLILDDRGALYGTTVEGGLYGSGIAFELVPGAGGKWKENVLHNFGNGKDGALPYTGMIFDPAHNLYGTTAGGGGYQTTLCKKSRGCGTIFEITRARDSGDRR
ncbi:MAG TPA: choice-of-anchor tandem repeat GloVer-containing protein [Candidatus Cybelea sp.]|nr:choice-of-anchor tandem repeat GloVer-containing protein [Candidatus Cybelea sp.]